jgi:hypothetical protein
MNQSLHEGYSLHLVFEIFWCSGDTVPRVMREISGPKGEEVMVKGRRLLND